jgi:DNA polymerase
MKPESCKACPYYSRTGIIWGVGAASAKLAIIGQSPGPEEIQAGEPFVGGSGRILNRSLSLAGVSREQEFVTNAVKCYVPPGEPLDPKATTCCRPLLQRELAGLPRCKTILALGQPAFNSLTGKELHVIHTRAKPETKSSKSTTRNPRAWLRGAVYDSGTHKIIGAAHPAFLARTGFRASPIFDLDVAKAASISRGDLTTPSESICEHPTRSELEEYIQECLHIQAFGTDIETPFKKDSEDESELETEGQASEIEMVGLSARSGECVSADPDQIELLAPLFNPEKRTITYAFNGMFDLSHLATHFPIGPNLQLYDPMLAMHLLYSEVMPQDLGTCMSLFTPYPYTKNLMMSDPKRYNAYDTFGVLDCGRETWRRLRDLGMEKLFWEHEMAVLPILTQMKTVGANCNVRLAGEYELRCYQTLQQYEVWWAENIKVVDWSSPKQLIPFFAQLGLPPQFETRIDPITKARKQTPTANDEALKYYEKVHNSQVAGLIRRMRALRKAGDFVRFYSSDGKAHSTFTLHRQVGGRVQSVHPNLQNLSEELELAEVHPRRIIIGDTEDSVVINADFDSIEPWVYGYLTQDPILLKAKENKEYIHGMFYEQLFKEPFFEPGRPRTKAFKLPNIPAWKLLRAKTIPMGLLYGRVDLEEQGLSRAEGDVIHRQFYRDHPAIKDFHE